MQTREQIASAIESLTALAASLGHGQTVEDVTIRVLDPALLDLGTARRAYVYERCDGSIVCVESSFVIRGEGKPSAPGSWVLTIRLRHYRQPTVEEVANARKQPSTRAKDAACKVADILQRHPVLGPAYEQIAGPRPVHTKPGWIVTDCTPQVNALINEIARVVDAKGA